MPVKNSNGNPVPPPMFAAGSFLPVFLVTALFMFWGIASNLNDILIKVFMKSFELARYKAALIQSAFFLGYFIVAVPAALVMRRFGYKAGRADAVLSVYNVLCLLRVACGCAGTERGQRLNLHLLGLNARATGWRREGRETKGASWKREC